MSEDHAEHFFRKAAETQQREKAAKGFAHWFSQGTNNDSARQQVGDVLKLMEKGQIFVQADKSVKLPVYGMFEIKFPDKPTGVAVGVSLPLNFDQISGGLPVSDRNEMAKILTILHETNINLPNRVVISPDPGYKGQESFQVRPIERQAMELIPFRL